MFAVALNSGSSPCSVAPSMEYVCALGLSPGSAVCAVYLVVCQELQAGCKGEWGRGQTCMCLYVCVCM